MSWFHNKNKIFSIIVLTAVFTAVCSYAYADSYARAAIVYPPAPTGSIFVYEVITKEKTYQTASKQRPDVFLFYNGGEDIIYKLTLLKVYPESQAEQASRDYNLDDKNVRYLPHGVISPDIKRKPFYWWR